MGQKYSAPPPWYLRDIEQLLDEHLAIRLPTSALEKASTNAFLVGLEPRAAAVQVCHEYNQRLCGKLIEQNDMASELMEFSIASRIDECGNLARDIEQDLLDVMPDLPVFVRQPCFSDEFRDMVLHIATWHGIAEPRWTAAVLAHGSAGHHSPGQV